MECSRTPSRNLVEALHCQGDPVSQIDLKTISRLPNATLFPRDRVIATLCHVYGKRLAEDVLKNWEPLQEQVKVHDVQKLLVGIAASVKRIDLMALFEQVRFGTRPSAECADLLSEEDKRNIAQADSFDQLNDEQLTLLTNLYREVFDENGERQFIGKTLFPHFEISGYSKFDQCLDLVRSYETIEDYVQNPKLGDPTFDLRQQCAGAEHLAREISYVLPDENSLDLIVPLLDRNGKTMLFTVKGMVIEKGLFFFTFVPLTKGQWFRGNESLCPVRWSFRGSNDRWAWVRNLTEKTLEAGHHSYYLHEPKIIQCTLDSVPPYNSEVVGSGHSLAGADQNRHLVSVCELRAQPEYAEVLNRIKRIEIVTWCPASLIKETLDRYEKVRKLSPIIPQIHHNYVDEDVVPGFAPYMLGHLENPTPEDLEEQSRNVSLTKYTLQDISTSVATTLVAHRRPLLINNANGVAITAILAGDLNYKLGPRGILARCRNIANGVWKNVWRFPKGTYTIVKGSAAFLFSKPNQERSEPLAEDSFVMMKRHDGAEDEHGESIILNEEMQQEGLVVLENEEFLLIKRESKLKE